MRNSAPLRFHQALNLKNFAASGDPIAVVASPLLRPIYAVAPPPQRGNPRCSFRIGEGPALQMLAAGNARNEESPAAVSLLL
jgi:hypothetical protein